MADRLARLKQLLQAGPEADYESLLAKVRELGARKPDPAWKLLEGEILTELERQKEAAGAYKMATATAKERRHKRIATISQALSRLKKRGTKHGRAIWLLTIFVALIPPALLLANHYYQSGLETKNHYWNGAVQTAQDTFSGLHFAKWLYEMQSLRNSGGQDSPHSQLSFELSQNGPANNTGKSHFQPHKSQSGGGGEKTAHKPKTATGADGMKGLAAGTIAENTGAGKKSGASQNTGVSKTAGKNFYAKTTPEIICPELHFHCDNNDLPKGDGPWRKNLLDLLHLTNIYYNLSDNCDEVAASALNFSQRYGWLSSESEVKNDIEHRLAGCYYRQKNYKEAARHAQKTLCTGMHNNPGSLFTLAQIASHDGQTRQINKYLQCMEKYHHVYQNTYNINNYTIYNTLAIGVYYWELNNNLSKLRQQIEQAEKLYSQIKANNFLLMINGMILYYRLIASAVIGANDNTFIPLMQNCLNNPWNNNTDILNIHIYNLSRLLIRHDYRGATRSFNDVYTIYTDMAEYEEFEQFIGLKKWIGEHQRLDKTTKEEMLKLLDLLDGKRTQQKVQDLDEIKQFFNNMKSAQ